MKVSVKWSESGKTFAINIAKKEGEKEFLSIKGCSIREHEGKEFVSFPATKLDDGKWFRYAWGDESFTNHVVKLANEGKAKPAPKKAHVVETEDDPLPF